VGNYVEELTDELDEQAALFPLDSEGAPLAKGDRVRISTNLAEGDWVDSEWVTRKFDFGRIEEVNEDGTVSVEWDEAQCGCSDEELSRKEKPTDLTKSTSEEAAVYHLGWSDGYEFGQEEAEDDFRRALYLPSREDEKELKEKAAQWDKHLDAVENAVKGQVTTN
jgi:hypothetical protein